MQNVYFATIFVLAELAALGLGWLACVVIRRKWSAQRRRRVQTQDLKLLAGQLVQAHQTIMNHLDALGGVRPPSAAVLRLREAAGQLRQLASDMAGGRLSAVQVGQGLLSAQEAILAAIGAGAVQAGVQAAAAVEVPVDRSAAPEPEIKSADELQAEINAVLAADESASESAPLPRENRTDPAEPAGPREDQARAAAAPELVGRQIRGLDDDELEEEMDALLSPKKTAAREASETRKPTEAEIEAEIAAGLNEMLNGAASMPAARQEEPRPSVALAEEPAPAGEPERKLTEAEIEAIMQADLEAMLSAAAPGEPPKNADGEDLQAEIDALLNGNGANQPETKPAVGTLPAEPDPPQAIIAASDLQAEIDALLGGAVPAARPEEPSSPTPMNPAGQDLQAEIDALLNGNSHFTPSPPASTPDVAANLQAEIDALLMGSGAISGRS